MKLTILALALSTYSCGASSRKLSAVAEAAEEDYYYDAEVNTYYDYADAAGSSCLCQGIKDYANAFLTATGVTLPPLQYVAPAGSSKVEPGTTPAQDVTLTYATVDALAAACGASRLDGGMHFTGAVAAGEELCKGIGTAGFEYASDLIGGEW